MLDQLGDTWEWLTGDLDASAAEGELAPVAEYLTAGERYLLGVARFAFATVELLLFVAMFVVMPGFAALEPWLGVLPSILLAISVPPLAWFVSRKPRALAKSAVLRAFARRAARGELRVGARASVVLDATSASGAPVAVSVDVDHVHERGPRT